MSEPGPGAHDLATRDPWQAQLSDNPYEPVTPRRPQVAKVLVWACVIALFTACGLLTVVAIAAETGVLGLAAGVVLAAVPVFPVVATFLWLDRYEAEPRALLLFAFGWGAAVATFGSLILNTASVLALQASGGDPTLAAVLVAPVVEETSKGLAVVGVLVLRRREFDGVVDGIVYAGIAGIGFAFVENVLYLGRALAEGGTGETVVVFVLRCLFSPFAHPLFTILIGVGIGLAVSRRNRLVRIGAPILGWVLAVGLHAAWNLSAVAGLSGFVTAYALLQLPVFVAVVVLAMMARRREGRLVRRHLDVYADTGWLTVAEVRMLSSLSERRAARGWAARTGGHDVSRAMRDFQELATELAFLRERMQHGTAPPDARQSELATLYSMRMQRGRFLPRWS